MCWYAVGRSSTAPVRPPCAADVRVRDGVIAEIGPDLAPDGEQEIDAGGRVRDPRHHRDAHPRRRRDVVEPRPRPAARLRQHERRVRLLRQLDRTARRRPARRDRRPAVLPRGPPARGVPRRSCRGRGSAGPSTSGRSAAQPTAVNVGGYLGHLSLRTYVMGPAAWERAATADEIAADVRAPRRGLARTARSGCRPTTSTRTARCGSCPASSPTTTSTARCSPCSPAIPAARSR